jgi:hypothetical protein
VSCHSCSLDTQQQLSLCLHQFLSKITLANIPCYTDPFAEADEDTGETKQSQNYIHIRIQRESAFPTPDLERTARPRMRNATVEISLLTRFTYQSEMVVRL